MGAANLGAGFAVGKHDVRSEVEIAPVRDQRRTDTVGVYGNPRFPEEADLVHPESPRRDDAHGFEARVVESLANVVDKLWIDAPWVELAHLGDHAPVDQGSRGVQADAVKAGPQRTGNLQRGLDAVVLEVHEHDQLHRFGQMVHELGSRERGVATVGRDRRMGNRADAFTAPPCTLHVRRHGCRARNVCCVSVAGLNGIVVVTGGKEKYVLGRCRIDDGPGLGGNPRPAGEDTEVEGFKMGKDIVGPFDGHHRLERFHPITVVEGLHGQRCPVVARKLQDRDGLVDTA